MQRDHLPDGFGTRSARRGRSSSLSMDCRQVSKAHLPWPPLVNPQPQYIAASAARQLITADQSANVLEVKPHCGRIGITDAALALLNGFLDNLLFSILLTAKSTKLLAIRPAVSEVLKPRLAREVVSAADDELGEYLGGSEDEELSEFRGGHEPSGHFELERSWKLTRLRCMVYSRLGDMEEEDEEDHLRREGLDDNASHPGRFSNHIGHITPAAAIFLTSILEYLGENALIIVADNTRGRLGFGATKSSEEQLEEAEDYRPLIVDEVDVEKIALNPTLGRLWRTWRKNSRVPALSRTLSRESLVRLSRRINSRQSSVGTVETLDEPQFRTITSPPPVSEDAESVDPADVPLPLPDHDIDEIEIPGFTAELAVAIPARSFRPRSLLITNPDLSTPTVPEQALPKSASALEFHTHYRSYSLPTAPFKAPGLSSNPDLVIIPPKKEREQLETMGEDAEHADVTRTRRSATLDSRSRSERYGSMEPELYLNGHGNPGSSVTSLHSDAIGVAIGHPKLSEAPSLISREGSRLSNGSSVYEDCEQQTALTISAARQPEMFKTQEPAEERDEAASAHPAQPSTLDRYSTSPAPIPLRSPRRGYSQEISSSAEANDTIVETAFVMQSASPPPRLSPLRELVAAATGTPDEQSPGLRHVSQSSISSEPKSTSRQSNRSISSQPTHANAKTPISGVTADTMTNARRSVSPGTERAAVQRVSPPPRSESGGFKPRRSESNSSFPERRPITSGSGTSQVSSKLKGLVGRQGTSMSARSAGDTNPEGTADLDQLIESDETLHYTLTPRTMRELEDPGSPRWASVRTDSVNQEDSGSIAASDGTSRGLKSSAAMSNVSNGLYITTPTRQSHPKWPTPQARDARAEVTSVREFANFIRYTGPDASVPKLHTPILPAAPTRVAKLSQDIGSPTSSSAPVPPRARSSMSGYSSTASRPRLEARSATTPKDSQTSDLIDFIREGPPRAGSHRIPRTVAPFRTTMDSDEFQSLSPTRLDRDTLTHSSVASIQDGSTVARSFNSSFNSRTGLLESANQANDRTRRTPIQLGSVIDSPRHESFEPIRTRRRVKDPYAIDSDSEDEVFGQPKRPQQKEESLVDFLRSVPPPASNNEAPPLLSVNVHVANELKMVKPRSKSTASTVKSRLKRTPTTDKTPTSKLSRSSLRSHKSFVASPTTTPADAPKLPSIHRASPTISSQPPFRQNSYASSSGPYTAHLDGSRNGYNKSPRPNGEARKPYYAGESGTAALAEFFRDTVPPPSPPLRRPITPSAKEGGSFSSLSRVFTRKKKQHV
ncbi:hypothetical protein PRK78_006362 [Emydomyces testavorans]|uniref:Uncharacterized protein n=1 Tax=Emydomyces testavorans TaxID=2070801 RepID=A0AAF0DM98_9EURO|nr:hypothetical protein PRK78_006362 [Emydomyces testavorans]